MPLFWKAPFRTHGDHCVRLECDDTSRHVECEKSKDRENASNYFWSVYPHCLVLYDGNRCHQLLCRCTFWRLDVIAVAGDRFKFFSGSRTKLSSGREVFCNRVTGRVSIVPHAIMLVSATCTEFATIDEHIHRLMTLNKNDNGMGPNWRAMLEKAIEAGVLLSMSDIRNRIVAGVSSSSEPKVIHKIGIPTRNRPKRLEAVLRGLLANLRRFGREIEVLVVDDSESAVMQNANQRLIASFNDDPRMTIHYADQHSRLRFARKLALESGLPEKVVAFAIGNPDQYPVSVGSSRNAILLGTLGSCLLYLDDDIQVHLAHIPESREEMVLQASPFSSWFFSTPEALRTCPFVEEDLLGLHERALSIDEQLLLHRDESHWPIDLSTVSTRFLRRIAKSGARIVASSMGIVGDSGFDDPLAYFLLGAETFSRLTQDEALYEAALTNRLLLYGTRNPSLSERFECHSYCMGVDNVALLPPFMPVMRGEELVFGSLVTSCIPGALFSVISRAILHQPEKPRRFTRSAAVTRAGRFMSGETLAFLIGGENAKGSSRSELIRSMGTRLQDLGQLSSNDLGVQARTTVEPMLVSWIEQLDEAVGKMGTSQTFWLKDVMKIREAILSALNDRDHSIPCDLGQAFGSIEGQRRFSELLRQFASLLQAWPSLVEGAKALSARGIDICRAEPMCKQANVNIA